ncbi:1-aminocyclopropane-1-carboxylate deaminase/D-cysteine desulfhydrase [Rheinheimera sp. WS51]|uniref:1-aminocyclopropane-1-carboxylate deaminase/D-cysteine desulfhydrase n=1 Tax=Rheinheimera sp. WS51 TaxID=3425886 RepID=UPI003D94FC9D
MLQDSIHTTINKLFWQQLQHPLLNQQKKQLWIASYQVQPEQLSGNKWCKLKYHLAKVVENNKQGIVTFGGAFSNHIAAVAVACQQAGMKSLTYLRADSLDTNNPTIQFCLKQGMEFKLLTRAEYRLRNEDSFCQQLKGRHPNLLLVPEGGTSEEAKRGIAELKLTDTPCGKADLIVLPTASGGTLAGVIEGNPIEILGIATVRDVSIPKRITSLLSEHAHSNWTVSMEYTDAGYAKFSSELLNFCKEMTQYKVFVEPIYSGKALYGLFKLIEQDKLKNYSTITFFHTGGLQGLDGLRYRNLISNEDYLLLTQNK